MCAVREARLCEVVDLSDGGDVVGDEALERRVELDLVGVVAADVLEEVAHVRGHVERLAERLSEVLDPRCFLYVLVQ